ncbi:MAG: protein serine/threonine phosphatase [Marmoricola sp.]|nr:protein serine/threonine phosphatase [Marmoricola sp.]
MTQPTEETVESQAAPASATPGDAALTCPSCSAPVGSGEQYCEACGVELTPSAAPSAAEPAGDETPAGTGSARASQDAGCHQCGGTIAADGYCTECGAKARSLRDHFTEQPASWVAGVCDRGVRHHRNEDAMGLDARAEPGSRAVLVVCDGVSSSTDSDVAALAAARAARDVLVRSSGSGIGTAGARVAATAQALGAAVDAANDAVIANTTPGSDSPASCTFVAGVVDASLLVVGWVGDSRAYWLPESGEPELLTTDDSYAAEQIAEGVSRADAESGPQAHAITRWLGSDAPDHTPRTISLDLDTPGWVLVCSDGLWNYCSEPRDLSALVRELDEVPAADPLRLAGKLVDWANAQGGADNVTVALARIGPHGTGPPDAPPAQSAAPTDTAHPKEGTHDGDVLS